MSMAMTVGTKRCGTLVYATPQDSNIHPVQRSSSLLESTFLCSVARNWSEIEHEPEIPNGLTGCFGHQPVQPLKELQKQIQLVFFSNPPYLHRSCEFRNSDKLPRVEGAASFFDLPKW